MISPSDERKLTAAFRRGTPDALRAVYAAYAPRVHGFALRLTGCRMDAEDLTQEVFVAAHDGRGTFSGRSKLLTWLLGIAVRRWRDMKRRGTAQTVPLFDEEVSGSAEVPIFDGVPGRQSMESRTIDSVLLERGLAELGEREREALLLVASQGLTYKEAAGVLDEPVGTVKWRVAAASKRMRVILEGYDNEDKEDKADAVRSMQR